jgi:sugar phosphate isomerase/epimerase
MTSGIRLGGSTWGFFRGDDVSTWMPQSEAVRLIVEAGFGVEVWPTRGRGDPDPSHEEIARMRDACSDAPFVSVHMRGRFWRWNPASFQEEIEFAADLGASTLVIHPICLGLRSATDRPDVEEIRRLAGFAAERNVRIALENVVDSAWALDRVLEDLGDDPAATNFAVCLDIGHAFLSEDAGPDPIRGYAERYADVLIHLHLHDNGGIEDDHLPVGEGRIDWGTVCRVLKEIGFAGTGVCEVHSVSGGSALRAIEESVIRLDLH